MILPSMFMKQLSYAHRHTNKPARLVILCSSPFKCTYSGDTNTENYVFRLTRRRIILPFAWKPVTCVMEVLLCVDKVLQVTSW
jgi:hypothetical protein